MDIASIFILVLLLIMGILIEVFLHYSFADEYRNFKDDLDELYNSDSSK